MVMQLEAESNIDWCTLDHEQEFICNRKVFRTRAEAYTIAKNSNQIIKRCGGDHHKLFSENLY